MVDKETIKNHIVKHIEQSGKQKFIDIAKWLNLTYNVSQGTSQNYLKELVDAGRLRTWYAKSRFYDLPLDKEKIIPVLIAVVEKSYLFKKPMTTDNAKAFLNDYGLNAEESSELILSLQHAGVIRTVKKNGTVYLAPEKLPLSLKVFLVMAGVISFLTIYFGVILGSDIQLMLPVSIVVLIVVCFIWYCQEKKILRG